MYVGAWSDLMIGMRNEIWIVPLRERYLGDNFQVGFLAYLRGVQLARPSSFCRVIGITP